MAGGNMKVERTTRLEFGGVPGTTSMVLGLPFAVYAINLACNKVSENRVFHNKIPGTNFLELKEIFTRSPKPWNINHDELQPNYESFVNCASV